MFEYEKQETNVAGLRKLLASDEVDLDGTVYLKVDDETSMRAIVHIILHFVIKRGNEKKIRKKVMM